MKLSRAMITTVLSSLILTGCVASDKNGFLVNQKNSFTMGDYSLVTSRDYDVNESRHLRVQYCLFTAGKEPMKSVFDIKDCAKYSDKFISYGTAVSVSGQYLPFQSRQETLYTKSISSDELGKVSKNVDKLSTGYVFSLGPVLSDDNKSLLIDISYNYAVLKEFNSINGVDLPAVDNFTGVQKISTKPGVVVITNLGHSCVKAESCTSHYLATKIDLVPAI